jgi:hypothetical protein
MKLLFLLLALISVVYCATPEDHAIYDLTDSIKKLYGAKSNFYTVLGVEPQADERTITKQYRKQSLKYHPDKNQSTEAAEIYKILTSIASTLKDEKLRLRYDKLLKKGIPVWRGTGYYYANFEPGFLFLFWFVLFFVSVAQYIINWVFYYRKLGYQEELKKDVRTRSYSEVKKEMKLKGVELKRKDFLKATPGSYDDDLTVLEGVEKPRILDLIIFQLPFKLKNLVAGEKKEKEE